QTPTALTDNAAITQHQNPVNGKTINYPAPAGHLSARNPQSGAAEATFFDVAYTADNQPLGNRPVTFFYNGGPGSTT
ncbi:peptidase S10, partial [Burkholderia pseudomallei]